MLDTQRVWETGDSMVECYLLKDIDNFLDTGCLSPKGLTNQKDQNKKNRGIKNRVTTSSRTLIISWMLDRSLPPTHVTKNPCCPWLRTAFFWFWNHTQFTLNNPTPPALHDHNVLEGHRRTSYAPVYKALHVLIPQQIGWASCSAHTNVKTMTTSNPHFHILTRTIKWQSKKFLFASNCLWVKLGNVVVHRNEREETHTWGKYLARRRFRSPPPPPPCFLPSSAPAMLIDALLRFATIESEETHNNFEQFECR
jgi:hypothetical protein